MQWAILSGIEGNLAADEAVIRRLVASHQRARTPGLYWLVRREEQCFSLHGLSELPDAPEPAPARNLVAMESSNCGNRYPGSRYAGCDRSTLAFMS